MELVREIAEGPLCPNSVGDPIGQAHRLRVRVLDAFYEAVDKNEDLEMPEPVERAYAAAAYEKTSDRMSLFWHTDVFYRGNQQVSVEAFWYRCGICGLVLAANRA